MFEWLNANIVWWHWIVFGLLLIGLEVLATTFLMLGIGVSAIITGAVTYLFGLSFAVELLLWSVLSALFFALWYRFIRQKNVTQSGQADYRLDTQGTVTEAIRPPGRGRVVFDLPVLGNREWPAFADKVVEADEKVRIVDVSGQLIKVIAIKES